MTVQKIAHVGLAVRSIEEMLKLLESCFGAKLLTKMEIPFMNQVSAMVSLGEKSMLELMEPMGEGPISKFLEEKGEGLHHISLKVDSVAGLVKDLEAKGLRVVGKLPPENPTFAFVHPKSTHGVLIELTEKEEVSRP
jgi:methylmalonyl-CoA epimerase